MKTILNAHISLLLSMLILSATSSCSKKNEQNIAADLSPEKNVESQDLSPENAVKVLGKSNEHGLEGALYALSKVSQRMRIDGKYFENIFHCAKDQTIRPQLRSACTISLSRIPVAYLALDTKRELHSFLMESMEQKNENQQMAAGITLVRLPQLWEITDRDHLFTLLPGLAPKGKRVVLKLLVSMQKDHLFPLADPNAQGLIPILNPSLLDPYTLQLGAELLRQMDRSIFQIWLNATCGEQQIAVNAFYCWRVESTLLPVGIRSLEAALFPNASPLWQSFATQEPLNAIRLERNFHE